MPVQAVPGAAVPAPAAAATAASPAARAAAAPRPAGPVDLVSLSPAALVRQALDAPVLAMRQLVALLGEFDQVAGLGRAVAPRTLGTLAGDIGAAAHDLGAGMQPLVSAGAAPTPLQLGATAALRVLAALAPAATAPADPRAPGPPPGGPDAPPPGPARPAPGATSSTAAMASPGTTARPAPQPAPAAPPRPAAAPPSSAPPSSAPSSSARPAAAPAASFHAAAVRADPSRADLAHQAREAAVALLGEAATTLGRMHLRLRAAPAPPRDDARLDEAVRDETWCEAQIGAALASVAQATRTLAATRPAAPPGIAALFAPRDATTGGRALRVGTLAALLCCLAAALWAAQGLDLGLARAVTGAALVVAALAWASRRTQWRGVRVEVRR